MYYSGAPLWWLAPPPLPRWEACHWILSRPRAPYESSSLATPLRGGTMGAGHFGQFEFMAVTEGKPYNRASPVEMHPFCRLRRRLSTGKRLTRFSVACGSLRIVFACHPGGGGFSGAMPCDTYEAEWEAESKLPSPGEVPPQAGIGVHFHRAAGPVGLFSLARQGGFKVLSKMAPKAPTTTL